MKKLYIIQANICSINFNSSCLQLLTTLILMGTGELVGFIKQASSTFQEICWQYLGYTTNSIQYASINTRQNRRRYSVIHH